MAGQLKNTTFQGYTLHEITTPDGRKIDEYAANGVVFGVAWQGRSLPDLSQVLGPDYFPSFQQALAS